MSAIAGVFYRDGQPVESNLIQKMLDVLRHRGPDGEGAWSGGPAGLGNRILWTAKSGIAEKLPCWDSSHRAIVAADCRLDNREELWRALECNGPLKEETPDSRLILESYLRWGEDCPKRLLGDFAFAIWDQQKRRFFCARDPFGVKPIYFHCSERLFLFASEIKGILQEKRLDRTLDESWIGDFLTGHWEDKTHTIYRAIRRLAPAHTLIVDDRAFKTQQYWSLDPERELKCSDDEECFEEFRRLFREAVRCRLRSEYPVGSMLSGGLDSSSISCVASAVADRSQTLFSISSVFPSIPQCDESRYIQAVAKKSGIQAHLVDGSAIGLLHEYKRKLWHIDQPLTGYNGHLGWNQLQRARDLGARVILDGTDGDSTVSYGNGYCRELATAGQWGALLQELAGAVSMHGIRTVRPFLRLVWTYGLRPRMPERLMKVRKLVGGRRQKPEPPENANPDERWDYLNADFLNRIGLIDLRKQEEAQKRFISSRDSHWKLVSSGRLPMLLDLLEHCASAFGIECRLPFCDRKLAEFCLAVPTRLKRHRSLDRYIMRHSLGDVLPKEVSQRPLKTDLTDVFVQAIKNHDREMWKNQYGHSLKAIEPYIDTEFFRGFSERFSRGALNALELRLAWRSMILGLWFREKIFSHDLPG